MRRYARWIAALMLSLAACATLAQAATGWTPVNETIRKSEKDTRQYQAIRLDNGLTVLLVSDAQQAELQARIAHSLGAKKQTHFLHQGNTGITQNLSFIGG